MFTPSAAIWSRAGAWVVLAAVIGCGTRDSVLERRLREYERRLVVTAETDTATGQIGQSLRLRVRIANRSSGRVEACIGPSDAVTFRTIERAGGTIMSSSVGTIAVTHPTCIRTLSLAPGESEELHREVQIPAIGAGPAVVAASVEVLDPTSCRATVGCNGVFLDSPEIRITLQR